MGKVLYLTGAPATGKSTLCKYLESRVEGLVAYSYSALLRDYINRSATEHVDEVEIRERSAGVVTKEAVASVDEWLINEVRDNRDGKHIVIDSHPVTKEQFGFRVTPFSQEQLLSLAPDVLVCLYADPRIVEGRIKHDPAGRPLPSEFDLAMHIKLQASLAAQYSFFLGRPCYLVDTSADIEDVASRVISLAHLESENR